MVAPQQEFGSNRRAGDILIDREKNSPIRTNYSSNKEEDTINQLK